MSTSTSTAGPVAGEPRTAVVLAGGAALGAMQAGMVHALYERGITPDLLIGTSAGALNAAFLASRPATVATAHELAGLWRGLRRRDILPLRPATLLSGLAGRRDHLIPDHALRRLAARHLQFARLEQAAIPLHLVAFDLPAGTEVRLSDGPLADAVLAAAAIPGVLPPVRWRGRLLADGGIADNAGACRPGARAIRVTASGQPARAAAAPRPAPSGPPPATGRTRSARPAARAASPPTEPRTALSEHARRCGRCAATTRTPPPPGPSLGPPPRLAALLQERPPLRQRGRVTADRVRRPQVPVSLQQ